MKKYTPGPWKFQRPLKVGGFSADGYQIFDDTHTLIAEIPKEVETGDMEETQANARLISMAPELLGWLQAIVRQMEYEKKVREFGSSGLDGMYKNLAKIIAKAEGHNE
jgi:hypothetical protein